MRRKNKKETLYSFYKNKLDTQNKENIEKVLDPLPYFITYLQYVRDSYILASGKEDFSEDYRLSTLIGALEEYKAAKTCIKNYYTIDEVGAVKTKDSNMTREESADLYAKEHRAHINNFWEIVKANIEGWFITNETNI